MRAIACPMSAARSGLSQDLCFHRTSARSKAPTIVAHSTWLGLGLGVGLGLGLGVGLGVGVGVGIGIGVGRWYQVEGGRVQVHGSVVVVPCEGLGLALGMG